jgi:hypothetical protein
LQYCKSMSETTPLLVLLDSVLSKNEEQLISVMEEIAQLTGLQLEDWSAPLRSDDCLCYVIQTLGQVHPSMASAPSEHDGSLPLHFAATLGKAQVAELLWSLVSYFFFQLVELIFP